MSRPESVLLFVCDNMESLKVNLSGIHDSYTVPQCVSHKSTAYKYSKYVYICMVVTCSKSKDQLRMLANPARGHLNREKYFSLSPFGPEKSSRETG